MEARDAEGDPNDLWVTFNSMGYNKALEPDQVCFYFVFFLYTLTTPIFFITKIIFSICFNYILGRRENSRGSGLGQNYIWVPMTSFSNNKKKQMDSTPKR